MGLVEIHRRIAKTEAGKDQLEWEKAIAMMDAYGSMYRSIRHGKEFSRTWLMPRIEIDGVTGWRSTTEE